MRLLLGPPGSGKSTLILDEVRSKLASPRPGFVLIAPTATMAEHLRNNLAREGLLVRPRAITTLAGFLDTYAGEMAAASPSDLELLVAAELDESKPSAFAALSGSAGLASSLAGAIEELSNTGCSALEWEALRGMGICTGPFAHDFGRVYDGVEQRLRNRRIHLRGARIAAAAQSLRRNWPRDLRTVYFDGFVTFSKGELELIRAIASNADLTVALPEWPGAKPAQTALLGMGLHESNLTTKRAAGTQVRCPAPSRGREVEDIAARIMELHTQGAAWRECLVILRSADPYLPLVRTVFTRLGIPHRTYFAEPLSPHPVARAFAGAVEAILSALEHGAVLKALRPPVTIAGSHASFAGFESKVLEGLPASGVAPLRTIAASIPGAEPVVQCLTVLENLAAAAGEARPAPEWTAALSALMGLLSPPPATQPFDAEARTVWRARSLAVSRFFSCLKQAESYCGDAPVALEVFWRNVEPILKQTDLRVVDHRRDAVAIVDAHEARQWESPYVFVCGLLEGEFPRRAQPEPILGDDLRIRLNGQGFALRLRKDREQEEDLLLDIAFSRATRETRLSFPQFNDKGEQTQPSFRIKEDLPLLAAGPRLRLKPVRQPAPAPPVAIDSVELHSRLAEAHSHFGTTALESFVQCPFQFHALYTLGLAGPPSTPSGRLDALFLGSVLHSVLQEWHKKRGDLERIFDSVWTNSLKRKRIPESHQTEFARIVMLRSLAMFKDKARIEEGWHVFAETPFELMLNHRVVRGSIDRYDVSELKEARIFDFKYSGSSGLKRRKDKMERGLLLQGGLYALALREQGLKPVEFEYCAMKKEPTWAGFEGQEEVQQEIDRARTTAGTSIDRILKGNIQVDPSDRDSCSFCNYLDICRVRAETAAEDAAVA